MLRNLKMKLLIIMSIMMSACTNAENEYTVKIKADKVFKNGQIYTVDEKRPWAKAIAIKGGNIIYVGNDEGLEGFVGEKTKIYDLENKVMMPGFIDTHAHPVLGGAYALSLSLDTYGTKEDWILAIKEYADRNSELPVIFGYGFLASVFGQEGPTKEMLDEVVSDRPVFIIDEGFHSGWANSKAIEILGIDKNTPDPTPGFDYYKRDIDGNPTGWFLEATSSMAMEQLNVFTMDSVIKGVEHVFGVLNSYGVTSVFDAGASELGELGYQVLDNFEKKQKFTVRFVGSRMVAAPEQIEGSLDFIEDMKEKTKNSSYKFNTLKVMEDGTIEGRTAGMFEDFQDESGNNGKTVYSEEQLTNLISDAASRQIDVHVHALGDRAIHETLNAIEYAKSQSPNSSTRYTICHIQVIADDSIERFAKLGVIAQGTPLWSSYDIEGEKLVSQDQFNRYFKFNSLHKAGAKVTFGSDFPASGAGELGMSPLFNIEIGMTRQFAGEADSPVQPPVEERLSLETLIRGYTIDAAYQLHMEDEIGSLEVGKKADFIILDQDPFETDQYQIHNIQIIDTIMNGNFVYQREK